MAWAALHWSSDDALKRAKAATDGEIEKDNILYDPMEKPEWYGIWGPGGVEI